MSETRFVVPNALPYGAPVPGFLAELARLDARGLAHGGPGAAATAEGAPEDAPEDAPGLSEVARLLDPAAGPELDELLAEARAVTDRVFGRSILLYAPSYLSSWCVNHCAYCGFGFTMPIPRVLLGADEAVREVAVLAARGLRRVLLVAGEYPTKVTPEYLERIVARACGLAPEIDLEVAPAPTRFYRRWAEAGAGGVVCYQETYDPDAYARLHPRGPKSRFAFRLGTLERAAAAGVVRLGAGVLLGLAEPMPDLLALVAHARFLQARYPQAAVTVSLPRLRPAVPGFEPFRRVEDDALLRFHAVMRLALPRAGLVVSTRESPALRRDLLRAGATQMSAGSVTAPGGYAVRPVPAHDGAQGQFEVADHRSVAEVAAELRGLGYAIR